MSGPSLLTVTRRTVSAVAGPLVFVRAARGVAMGELGSLTLPDGRERLGQVLEVHDDLAVVQVYEGTEGIDAEATTVRFLGGPARIGVSRDMLGRVFDGMGRPIDGGPPVLAERVVDVHGLPLNPSVRDEPNEFIETGVSAIDALNSLVRGQKLPIFSAFGLPAAELAAQISAHARVRDGGRFAVVFAGIGITHREAAFFMERARISGAQGRTVMFLDRADGPVLARLLVPRYALSVAEHLAFAHATHVLVILTDMTNYCEALREVGAARDEIPGRRGYPGYMYTDLATIYERAGRIRGTEGSVTQLPILSMPDDDISHPIPDLTGYITEGQIVLSRELHRRGIAPPIDVLPSLSRLMGRAIGPGRTRDDHRALADQLYATYAEGRRLRRLEAILGEAALSEVDRAHLAVASAFEERFIGQRTAARTLDETLDLAWELIATLPLGELKRLPREMAERHR